MLLNFCERYLETEVKCNVPSTDGYEINNLLTSEHGFLAYACIKPPIHIDFHFICNIRLSHVLIWPCVGSQKSSGLRISTKCKNEHDYRNLSTEFLSKQHTGVMFYTRNGDKESMTLSPNFSKKLVSCYDNIDNLRLTILKTENSVPAISKVQIWGLVAAANKLEITQKVIDLRHQHYDNSKANRPNDSRPIGQDEDNSKAPLQEMTTNPPLEIPAEYLDPITFDIMQQPVVLPSGTIIDQATLDNFEKNEASWGRPLSDPFTGIVFNDSYKPIFSSSLKCKIDKFISLNSKNPQFQKLPRTLGRSAQSLQNSSTIMKKIHTYDRRLSECLKREGKFGSRHNLSKRISRTPVRARYSPIRIKSDTKVIKSSIEEQSQLTKDQDTKFEDRCNLDDNLKDHLNSVLLNLKRFDNSERPAHATDLCNCCTVPVFYKLPCAHIVCRQTLTSISANPKCPHCCKNYNSSDIIKVHV